MATSLWHYIQKDAQMSLKTRQKAAHKTESTTMEGTPYGRASWAQPFLTPIHGTVDGEPARLIMFGDQPGSSPVYLCVDEDGNSAIVPLVDVTITDGAFLPLRMKKASR
jgi:hypothetical protein